VAVKTLRTKLVLVAALVCGLSCPAQSVVALGQQLSGVTKVYRGSIGDRNIEMRLNIQGSNVTGTYSYDGIGEALTISGHVDDQGRLQLTEYANRKQTGKFSCKRSLDDPIGSECTWSRPDGTHETFVYLSEQHVATNGYQVTPKIVNDRRSGVRASYPQITNDRKALTPGAQAFNRRVFSLVQKAIKEFDPAPDAGRNYFKMNYNVLFAADDVISVELGEDAYAGGAHPNSAFYSVTYDLAENKELRLDDLFKPGADCKSKIAEYVVADIDKRADALEQEEFKRSGQKPQPREGPLVSVDELSEISYWGISPDGLVVYFDFPHVIAVFDKNVVPYSVIKNYLKPNTPVSRFNKP